MNLVLLSINYKTASLALREQYAFSPNEIHGALQSLTRECGLDEAVIISTCNRTEIYAITDQPGAEARTIMDWWHHQRGDATTNSYAFITRKVNNKAVRHLMRTACGLESMVMGEPQILGQIKMAFRLAQQARCVGAGLAPAFESAFSVAKKVRTSTEIGCCPVSVAFSAASLAKKHFACLSECRILLLGAGHTARLTAEHLAKSGPKALWIANRTLDKARQLATATTGTAVSWNNKENYYNQADIIITALGKLPEYAVPKAAAISERSLLIDLSVPRAIEPGHSALTYTVDDIQSKLNENERVRSHAATIADDIIDRQVQAYVEKLKVRRAAKTIVAFRRHTEDIVNTEVQKSLKKIQNGADPETVLTRFAYSLQNKILHKPTLSLRQASVDGDTETLNIAQALYSSQAGNE